MRKAKTVFAVLTVLVVVCGFSTLSFAVKSGDSITWPGGGAGRVVFEGEEHAEEGYACKDCHPSLFEMKKGSARITMDSLNTGRYCGACHNGRTAFGTDNPKKCHKCHKQKDHHDKKHSDEDDDD